MARALPSRCTPWARTKEEGASGPTSDHPTVIEADYRDGQAFTYQLGFSNTSSRPVRIVKIGEESPRYSLLRPYAYMLADSRFGGIRYGGSVGAKNLESEGALRPFAPFTIRPGENVEVVVNARFGSCEFNARGASSTQVAVPIFFKVLGFTRRQDLDFTEPVKVVSPEACPRPGPARPTQTPSPHRQKLPAKIGPTPTA
ncbi:MAG: hypothetical protein LC723_01050 [Actinobacteria bacterium]|nr:hypothetical protein [Actinomycetota bacterium]